MSEESRRADDDRADEPADPTAEFLADVRPEETPWRTERPPAEQAGSPIPDANERTRFQRVAGAVGGAAPYLAAGGAAGWVSAQAYDEYADEAGGHGGMEDMGMGEG
ncbi:MULTISPECIES: hypothetical protein [Prauserella salsuginis group]|uniref:Uncharacterized protein n=2 Tax=Prauserella salsuginis group TaxID=2893672 RepID=A0A839XW84_9PSEU|nr:MULTISPECIES: hypothetical protein [Prauserella salsuginis group]MBB3664286.1 hypothetical protein [Prauserella sediminis]MCR3721731.1 hypothetical protein [Prauserella flava]MCR3734422.1 hypothetical protein [Prauserella salsuginis]